MSLACMWVGMATVHLLNSAIAIESIFSKDEDSSYYNSTNTTHLATIAKVSDSMAKRDVHDVRQFSKRNLETCRSLHTLYIPSYLGGWFPPKVGLRNYPSPQNRRHIIRMDYVSPTPNQAENIRLQHMCTQNGVSHTTGNHNDKPQRHTSSY